MKTLKTTDHPRVLRDEVIESQKERMIAQTILPRWRGFNLIEMGELKSDGNWREEDFAWIADWGFDFVRLPLCYALWTDETDNFKVKEEWLVKVDRGVDLGRKYGLHVCLNFHRAPGYSVSTDRQEPFSLWKDQEAQDVFCFHWGLFAERYAGIDSKKLSFNLVNEPGNSAEKMSRAEHERVMRAAIETIRRNDPSRLVILDGLGYGREPSPEFADLAPGVAQSCRAYNPFGLSHYKATWVKSDGWPEPVWPGAQHKGEPWDRRNLEALYAPWAELARQGVGVHCGEGGAFNHTSHDVFLRWYRDVLEILTAHNIGWALWHLRGSFGVLDSGRSDVKYEDWRGCLLDRKLLDLLKEF